MTISSNRSKTNNEMTFVNQFNNGKFVQNHENVTIMNLNLDTNNLKEQQAGSHVIIY